MAEEERATVVASDGGTTVVARGEVARGGLWSIGGKVGVLAASTLGTPATIRLLGPTEFGLWSLLLTLVTYLVVSDLGMATGSTKFSGECLVNGDLAGEGKVVWTAGAIGLVGAGSCGMVLALSGETFADVVSVPPSLVGEFRAGLVLVGLTLVVRVLNSVVCSPAQVRMRWKGLTLANGLPAAILPVAIPFWLWAFSGGLAALAGLTLCAGVVSLMANCRSAVKILSLARRPHVSWRVGGRLARYGFMVSLTSVVVLPLAVGERFVLAHYWSPAVVAPYAVGMTFASSLSMIAVAAIEALFPAFVRLVEGESWVALSKMYARGLETLVGVLIPVSLIAAFVSRPLLDLYAGNKTGDSALTPFLILLAGFVANSVGYIPYVFLLARGRVRTILFVHLGEVLPYWLLAVDMIHRFGAVGAAASWASRALVDSALFLWLTHRDEHLDVGWLPVVRRPVWLIGGLLVATLWALDRVGEGIWLRVTLGSVAGTVAGWALLMWLLTEEERVIALERVRNIKSKFQKGGRERSA